MSIGPWQILLILVLVFMLFGAGKLPRLMGDVAEGIKAFKRGMKDEASTKEDTKDKPENDA
ncbi:MAG: twin-arginine translocase TatA/TatE family subunit [Alphaproteobacteria bacterium]|jgi:sec-independent protein translocase protein TatA|nr:twin-arginine translocase TatA/TatE family subunit [Alphaproteobacteria bacterium]MCB1551274.1 twin-arginine translocase TatA/TatE family subunit [Alphaproteobacteria bacterium]MCB9984367.1 twin-arginine translocase TatA/TatE family subunit [Micavibrio sp.]HPQ50259.1 twin-arginine translocase TatA/TatE family subunit [Alphaproteobacteria bacterium]HRK97867.1 twin-arginine translocase TatA/TatE family subunit [Alphaproteobacteria bacterium]